MEMKLFVLVIVTTTLAPTVMVNAQLGGLGGVLSISRVGGSVYCTADGNVGANATLTPAFTNAIVQLQCGRNVVATTTTNGSGVFSMVLPPLTLLSTLLNECSVNVPTPLSNCNASLPKGGILQSPLHLLGSTSQGLLTVFDLVPSGFCFLNLTT